MYDALEACIRAAVGFQIIEHLLHVGYFEMIFLFLFLRLNSLEHIVCVHGKGPIEWHP